MEGRCRKCGSRSDADHFALLLGKKPYEKSCSICGAEMCPRCGHRRSAHIPKHGNPLQDKCDITWDGAFCCGCTYYGAVFDEEMKWDIVPLHEGILGL